MVSPDVEPETLGVLCGPTAVGKTALAVALAQRLDAEIVCADSRTIYRGMDIGTAKPDAALRAQIPHHLLDVAEPSETFTLADFQRLAARAIRGIYARGRVPLLVGGTGLYIRAIVDDLALPRVAPDHALRARLAEEEAAGPGTLHRRLARLDPAAASRIHPANVRRIIRALEVIGVTRRPISEQQRRGEHAPRALMIGLTAERIALYRRIDARVDAQLAAGLVDETQRLLARDIPATSPSLRALGYEEIAGWLRGAYGYDEAVRLLKRNTRRYAKRQLTWFRRDPRIRWIDVTGISEEALLERTHAMMGALRAR
jgi:tRNA dimethylallyltransferase